MKWFNLVLKRSSEPSNEVDWEGLVKSLVNDGIVTDKEVAECVLGALNPMQFGSSIASKAVYQKQYPPRKTFAAALEWALAQSGQCTDCGTRLNLEIDHIIPRRDGGEDKLSNHTLRCRRCNSSRRHANGRKTELTTQAALVYVMVTHRPKTYNEYRTLCREYGLTCSDIRIKEGWVLRSWLSNNRVKKPNRRRKLSTIIKGRRNGTSN